MNTIMYEGQHNCTNTADSPQEQVSDYPLVSKAKGAAAFRNALHDFFVELARAIAQTGLMYEENQLMENIQVWVCTMTSATNRPLRYFGPVPYRKRYRGKHSKDDATERDGIKEVARK